MLGERLRQARLMAGLTQEELVESLQQRHYSITKQAISKYEKNKSTPPAEFLMLAASALKIPNSYFFHTPQVSVDWLGFRRHSALAGNQQENVQNYASDIVELQVELRDLLYPQRQANLPERQSVSTFEQAEKMAQDLRDQWGLDDQPIGNLTQTVETHQVIVVAWKAEKFDGLSGRVGGYAVTVMNTDRPADRSRFTLAHEIGHLLMDVTEEKAESLANRFAGALLVPAEQARRELSSKRSSLGWDELGVLKQRYGLSMAGWIYRAKDLGIITEHYGTELQKELSTRGWRKQEPFEYIADERPVLLEQMIAHATAEGLISSDRIRQLYPQWQPPKVPVVPTGRLTVYDLLALPFAERNRILEEQATLAKEEDFEVFDAIDLYDYPEDEE
jgi:Zn-dependent peptidase ImmA (M78 family)/DNA-binding XRE family transcriptional regulator